MDAHSQVRLQTQKGSKGPSIAQAPRQVPPASSEVLSYYKADKIEEPLWLTLPQWFMMPDESEAQIVEHYQRFTSYLVEPILDSFVLNLAVAAPATGLIKIELIPSQRISGVYYPNETASPIAEYELDAATLIPEENNRITVRCNALKLPKKDFVISIETESMIEEVLVAFDNNDEYRDRDDEIDRSYIRYVDWEEEEYYASLGGLFVHENENYYFPNMIAEAYLHEGNSTPRAEEWKNGITASQDDLLEAMIRTQDGGHLLVGTTASTGGQVGASHGLYDCLVAKYDKTGSKQWAKVYGGSDDDQGFDAVELKDGTIVILAHTRSWDSPLGAIAGDYSTWLMWLDRNGNSIRDRAYDPRGWGSTASSLAIDSSDNKEQLIVTGWAGGGLWNARLTNAGDTLWNTVVESSDIYILWRSSALSVLPSGDFALANGSGRSENKYKPQINFYNANGELQRTVVQHDSATGLLAAAGDTYATLTLDTITYFDKTGAEIARYHIPGLIHPTSIDPVPGGFAIGGRAIKIGESISKPVYFLVDTEGRTKAMAPITSGIAGEIDAVLMDGEHVLVGYDQLRESTDIFVERVKPPVSALRLSSLSDIQTCRGHSMILASTVSLAWYPVATAWYNGSGEQVGETFAITSPSDGNQAELIQLAAASDKYELRVSDATGGQVTEDAAVKLGIEVSPEVIRTGDELSSSVQADAYQWIDGTGTDIPLATTRNYTPKLGGSYAVRVTAGACSELSPPFEFSKLAVNSEEVMQQKMFYLSLRGALIVEGSRGPLEIVNSLGQVVFSSTLTEERSEFQLQNLARGVYFVRTTNGQVYSFVR